MKRAITIDNGGSELRFIANNDGRTIHTMDKNIRIVERDTFRIKDNVEEYDIIDITQAPNSAYCGMYSCGIGYYMYEGVDVGMNNQNRKTNTLAWYQQVLIAIAKDAMKAIRNHAYLPETNYSEEEVVDISVPCIDYVLTTLIPVHEHSGSTDYVSKLKANLEGTYEVEFPIIQEGINKVRFNLHKDRIGVLPEGVVVMTSFKNDVAPNDHTLIIDMGHVTTDLVICKGIKMLGNSVESSPFAGGTLLKQVMAVIRDHGCTPNEEMAIEALQTYKFRIGKREIDITDAMNQAKRMFVNNFIKSVILNQIELAGITTASIQNVVPIGAVLGIKNPITQEYDILQMIIEECNLSNADIKIVNEDLRYVNISKAADFCEVFAKKV